MTFFQVAKFSEALKGLEALGVVLTPKDKMDQQAWSGQGSCPVGHRSSSEKGEPGSTQHIPYQFWEENVGLDQREQKHPFRLTSTISDSTGKEKKKNREDISTPMNMPQYRAEVRASGAGDTHRENHPKWWHVVFQTQVATKILWTIHWPRLSQYPVTPEYYTADSGTRPDHTSPRCSPWRWGRNGTHPSRQCVGVLWLWNASGERMAIFKILMSPRAVMVSATTEDPLVWFGQSCRNKSIIQRCPSEVSLQGITCWGRVPLAICLQV